MLGFDVSERTISRWMKRAPRDPEPARRWLTFLRNHREAIAAMDFFTVPTFAPQPQVKSFLMFDWEGCTTGTIGLLNPNQRSVAKTSGFPILIYTEYMQVCRAGVVPGEILGARG
jgi:hypothetical protein